MSRTLILPLLFLLLLPLLKGEKNDAACKGVRCGDGYRCLKGACVAQLRHPKKNTCMDNKFSDKVQAVQCEDKDRKSNCLAAKNVLSCGYSPDGTRIDFTNDCSPCLNANVAFYYRLACADAPAVCSESQECINGKCFGLFDKDTDEDRNMEICNKSADCDPRELCVANKCVGKHDLLKTLRKGKDTYK